MKVRKSPPRIFLQFFRWFCHPALKDSIEGDLMELYNETRTKVGKGRADLKFIIDVVLLFRPGIIKPLTEYQHTNQLAMFKSNLKVASRNLIKNKMVSIINISGLSLGLTCSILIALWIEDEYNIDAFHKDIDRIYTVTSCEYSGDEINGSYDTPGLLGEELKRQMPEVEFACNYSWTSYNNLANGNKKVKKPGNFAGTDFFKIFSYPLILGKKEAALKTTESIAVSRTLATELFGSPELAIDKTVRFDDYKDLKVTAVFEDMKDNVSDKVEFLCSWEFFVEREPWVKNWNNSGPYTFVKLREHVNPETLSGKMQHFIKNYDKEYSDLERLELGLQPFAEKYLNSNFEDGHINGGRIEYVQLFKVVAIFILLIACINFMNLSTARSLKRAKEIGVRKVIGAMKSALIGQFMLEAFIFTLIAVVIAISLLSIVLPHFNTLTAKSISSPFISIEFWLGIATLTILTAMVSGSYPSFLLSSFKPIAAIKNNLKISPSSGMLRKGLVICQFALSMLLIVSMIVISKQVDFIQNKNLGYDKSNFIYLPITGSIGEKFDLFKHEALKRDGIVNITQMSGRPVEIDNSTGSVEWEGKAPNTRPTFTQVAVGYDFIKTMRASLLYGRDFSEDHADSASYIVNETALRIIGYKDPIGMPLSFWGVRGTIIGVVKDFHFNSLHVPINPLVIRLKRGTGGYALVRTAPGKTQAAISGLEKLYKEFSPALTFAHQFADEEYQSLYAREEVVKQLSGYFAFLAIFISCLGLLGLAMFEAEQRTKEIGVRKVLGASVLHIVFLLSRDFGRLILISIVISSPIAYYFMTKWLTGFEYHIDIHWGMFFLAAFGASVIAGFVVGFHAVRAAIVNPVNSLKTE